MVDKSLSVHISGGTELIFWIFVRKKPWCQQFEDIEDMKPTPGICSQISGTFKMSADDIRRARTRSGRQSAECVLGKRTAWGWAVGRPWKTPWAAPTRYRPVQPGSQSRRIPRSHPIVASSPSPARPPIAALDGRQLLPPYCSCQVAKALGKYYQFSRVTCCWCKTGHTRFLFACGHPSCLLAVIPLSTIDSLPPITCEYLPPSPP